MSSITAFFHRKRPRAIDIPDEDLEDLRSRTSSTSSVYSWSDESEDLNRTYAEDPIESWIMSHELPQSHANGLKLKKRFQMQTVADENSSEDEPVQATKRMRMFSCQRTIPIQSSRVTHDNSETRPWQRLRKLKKPGDSSSWCSDIKHRDGHIHTSKHLKRRDKLKMGAAVRPSPRNKKQHLRELTSTNTLSDDAEDSTLLSQENCYIKRSFSPSTTFRLQQSSSLHDIVQDEDFVYPEEEILCEDDQEHMHSWEDTMDGYLDEGVDTTQLKNMEFTEQKHRVAECEFLRMKNEQLRAELQTLTSENKTLTSENKTLTSENKKKDAQIRKLQQGSDKTIKKPLKGRIGDLEWRLLYKPDGQPQVLGNGSYGMVYKALCVSAGSRRYLAAKVVLDLTQKSAETLKKELKQLIALEPHDRIVTYFGTCYAKHPRFDEKCLFVFTEFMPGGSLSSYLEKNGPLTTELMWHYTEQILEGVEYLHKCKIIHRDIKGSNIMRDMKNNIKLADFGSAKQICSESLSKDKTRYPYGTAPWTAPEVLRGDKAQPESDIWSVASTIVEMLTGEMPYKSENFDNRLAIVYQVGSNNINPLTSMKKSGYELDSIVERVLSFCFKSTAKERPSAAKLSRAMPTIKAKYYDM